MGVYVCLCDICVPIPIVEIFSLETFLILQHRILRFVIQEKRFTINQNPFCPAMLYVTTKNTECTYFIKLLFLRTNLFVR